MDCDAIVKVLLRGDGQATGVAVSPFVIGWPHELNAYAPNNLTRAPELLAEAGYPAASASPSIRPKAAI